MEEIEAEHVRMMDAGRLQLAYTSPLASDCFQSTATTKFHVVAHGNKYGVTFVPVQSGFAMVTEQEYAAECADYIARRLDAIDRGQNASHVEVKPIVTRREVALASIAYALAVSADELHLAVAYGTSLALFEVAAIYATDAPKPYHVYEDIAVEELAWCPVATGNERNLVVVTHGKAVFVCSTDGSKKPLGSSIKAASLGWSPSGDSLAVGTADGTVEVFARSSLAVERSIARPECCDDGFEAHHINWVEDDLILVGYRKYDADQEETAAQACLFEAGECVELDEVVAFFDVENRQHQYYSVYLPEWRMFFIGCSMSADIELVVADEESGQWQLWKPSEKYQARLPMTSDDEEMYPLGLTANLNAQLDIDVDDGKFPPAPIVSCATAEGLLVNFSFIDMSVQEKIEFIQKPASFLESPSRQAAKTSLPAPIAPARSAAGTTVADTDNEFAQHSDDDDDDDEEEKEEERQSAFEAFDKLDSSKTGEIPTSKFADLLESMGTTYCEESHAKHATKLADVSGHIAREVFAEWYVSWVFGELESDDEDEEDDANAQHTPGPSTKNVLDKFLAKEGSWRCETCMISNDDPNASQCASCETPNPNFKGTAAPASSTVTFKTSTNAPNFNFGLPKSTPSASFNFGFAPTNSTQPAAPASSGGFSFGAPAGKPNAPAPSAPSGFSFGVPAGKAAAPASSAPTGFSFGVPAGKADAPASTTPSGFSFGVPANKSGAADTKKEEKKEDAGYGKSDENVFNSDDDDDSDEEAERKEEEDRARAAFKKVAQNGLVTKEQYPSVFKALGTTYDDEQHGETFVKLNKNGKVFEEDFVQWYVSWIFDEGDSEEEEDEDDVQTSKPALKSAEEIAAAMAKFKPKEGEWKCSVCMVTNSDPNAPKCSACETPNPNAPKADLTKPSAPSAPGAIGAGGFQFPSSGSASTTSTTSSGFQFGIQTPSTEVKPTTGFTFGFPSSGTSDATKISFGVTPAPQNTTSEAKSKPAAGGYPPDTSTKPKPPPFGASSGYPPDTSTKPKPPAFGASSGYPPDTSTKPKPPAFGASSGYPPDTSTKPKPPAFGASSGYPPDTSTKPKPPAFGASSGYPPDTSTKPKPPAFGASSGYPPDTSTKPKPPAFGASSGYPPDTSTKPKPPAFGAGSGYPPDTQSLAKPPAPSFGVTGDSSGSTKSAFSFSAVGSSLFGSSKADSSATKPSLFSSGAGTKDASSKESPSPFGVVPSTSSAASSAATKTPFAFAKRNETTALSAPATAPIPAAPQRPSIVPSGSSTVSATSVPLKSSKVSGNAPVGRAVPSSVLEGQLWKLIADFDRAYKRVNQTSKSIKSADSAFASKVSEQLNKLQKQVSDLCDEVNNLDESRDQIEKDVLFIIGSDGDVHEQLEYGREILASFKNEKLKRLLEEQPLDQRSEDTKRTLREKLEALERSCTELDQHIASTKNNPAYASTGNAGTASSAHLFRVLKQTYDNSKMQYNKVCELSQHLESLSVNEQHRQSKGHGPTVSTQATAKTKQDMVEILNASESRSQDIRRNFLELCKNVVSPREISSTPRRKLSPSGHQSPTRASAPSRLMPRMQLTVESPVSSTAKNASSGLSFKGTPVKSGSRLFAVVEEKAPKEVKTFIPTPQKSKQPVTLAPQRPSIPSLDQSSSSSSAAFVAKAKSTGQPAAKKALSFNFVTDEKTTNEATESSEPPVKKTLSFGVDSPKPTPFKSASDQPGGATLLPAKPKVSFQLPGKSQSASTVKPAFASKPTTQSSSSGRNYKDLLVKFYQEFNSSKMSQVDKTLEDFKGKEEMMFTRLFTKYLPNSNPDDVKKYLDGGPVPKKPADNTATSGTSAFGFGKSPAGPTPAASPFGKSAFSLGAPAATATSAPASGGFGGFTSSTSSFGKPAVDYKQRLIEFYQKHNPDKLKDVDSTLEKYKGREEKLFENLAAKYGGSAGAAAAQPKTNPSASPFGNTGAFTSISLGGAKQSTPAFGSTSTVGFGATPAPTGATPSPFGAPAATSSSFGGFVSTAAASKPAFGSTNAVGGFGSGATTTNAAFGSTATLGGGMGFGATSGENHRDRLIKFYQQYNPEKLKDVDSTLAKYKGNEAKLFAMLEQKYLKPANPTPAFGAPAATSSFGGGGFGAPSQLGGGSAAPAFGSASALGGTAAPSFGAPARLGGGGMSSAMGGFAAPAPPSAGAAAGGGFSSFSSQGATFGGFGGQQQQGGFGGQQQQQSGFGGQQATGFGGGFGSNTGGGFGSNTFGGSSFSQMR
ncbi:hypothetical protein Poli38472_005427 [Pythium oligandrum]|uniref:Uncharacterized protein n=1 Tax=Pythium oligandrum TaxID=41045 RepID=A0A8K1CGV4_PYTOL|nr:hypothetical protein Poli38472_005427 [Pythium oligandrum]|eukprot:TMW62809.1 hypothetical protein Poli38472_005427 [Pythium oligandrum]